METDDPVARLRTLVGTLSIGTLSMVGSLGAVTFGTFIVAIQRGPTIAGYALVALVAVSCVMTAEDLLDESPPEVDLGWPADHVATVLAVVYVNALVAGGAAAAVFVGPSWGLTVAVAVPLADLELSRRTIPFGLTALAGACYAVLIARSTGAEHVSWRTQRPPLPRAG